MADDDLGEFVRMARRNASSGPCEDSVEVCAIWINHMPEESESEDGSPLQF